jgi:hypothetical protein
MPPGHASAGGRVGVTHLLHNVIDSWGLQVRVSLQLGGVPHMVHSVQIWHGVYSGQTRQLCRAVLRCTVTSYG